MVIEKPSLLITDDDRGFRETLQEVLERQGYRTHLAGDGEEALEIVRRQVVHVALLDVHMPKLTGLETLRVLRRHRLLLPCILMSARLDEALVRQARLLRAFSVLAKPVNRIQITGVIRKALETAYQWPGEDGGPADEPWR